MGPWPAGRTSKGQTGLWKAERAGALKGKLLQVMSFWSWTDQGSRRVLTLGGGLWHGKVSPRKLQITKDQGLAGSLQTSLEGGEGGK